MIMKTATKEYKIQQISGKVQESHLNQELFSANFIHDSLNASFKSMRTINIRLECWSSKGTKI